MFSVSAAIFLAIGFVTYVVFGLFEAMSKPRVRWYKRFFIIWLFPVLYVADWLDKREF